MNAMDRIIESRTRASLLARLRQAPADQAAWGSSWSATAASSMAGAATGAFRKPMRRMSRRTCSSGSPAKMRGFDYDPSRSFRAWLKTLARHALSDFCDARKQIAAGGSQVVELLQSIEAREDLVQQLDEEFDREVLEEAVARVRARVTPKSWRVFEMTAQEGRSGAETASALGMTVAAVFVAKGRVQKLLQEEVRQLEASSTT